MNKFEFIKKVDLIKFIYLINICRNVIHKGRGKIIPYKNSVINFSEGSKIILHDGDLEIGVNKLNGSKTESFVRLYQNSEWNVRETCSINYGCTIEVLKGAVLNTKYFTMNSNSVLVCSDNIEIQHDVMIGRNVVIYDSDYHQIRKKSVLNASKPVSIGTHVWLGTNSMILKGAVIGENCIIGAGETVRGVVEANRTFTTGKVFENKGRWER